MAELQRDVAVYLGDQVDASECVRQKATGGMWTAHFLEYDGGEATSWGRHFSELGDGEALTELDIVNATAAAVVQRLGIAEPNVRYIMPSVGTQHGVRFSRVSEAR